MSINPVAIVDAALLRYAGRNVAVPFSVLLPDGSLVLVQQLLRILPGKRVVGQGIWNGCPVLVKLFIAEGSRRHWNRERRGLDALRTAKIVTPEVLLAAELPGGGHVFLTRFIESAVSLLDAWQAAWQSPGGQAAAVDVLRPALVVLGTMHAAGLVQNDLHLGNFLRQGENLFVIDGDDVRVIRRGKSLDEPTAGANLALLLAQLPVACDTLIGEWLGAYRMTGCRVDEDAVAKEVRHIRQWRLRNFLSKTVRDCTRFSVSRSASRLIAVVRSEQVRLEKIVQSPDRFIQAGSLLKDGRTCSVAKIETVGAPVVVKRYNLKNTAHALGRLWRPSRAWHSWHEGHRLAFFNIPTPAPLALVEERWGPLRRRAFLVTEYCPGISLLALLSADCPPADDVARALIGLFQQLYSLHISHGDLKANNLLWHDNQIYLIDLDAMIQHRSAASHARAWRRDRARLLRNWPNDSVLFHWLNKNLPPVSP